MEKMSHFEKAIKEAVEVSNRWKDMNPMQFKIASLLAYHCLLYNAGRSEKFSQMDIERLRGQVSAIQHACTLLEISEDVSMRIRKGKIEGLQNIGRLLVKPNYYTSDYSWEL